MSLVLPHTVLVFPVSTGNTESGQATTETYGGSTSVRCQVTPTTAATALETFGADVSNGFLVICSAANGATFTIRSKVTWSGREFRVAADPLVYTGIGSADHASVLLTEWK
jgi:hypothetical protein